MKMEEKIKEIAKKTTMTTAEVAESLKSQAEKGLPLNLQFFSESEGEENVETTENTQDDEQDNATFTRSDVDREVSKAVESALSKREAKLKEEMEARIEEERNEAAEYAKLTQKEQEEAEYKKRIEELEKREQELNNRQLLNQIESDLKDNSLPIELADTLLSLQDNEKIKTRINDIKSYVDELVNGRVKEALRQETPNASTKDIKHDPFQAKIAKYK